MFGERLGGLRRRLLVVAASLLVITSAAALPSVAGASDQNDAHSGGDAGDTFETATSVDTDVDHRYNATMDPAGGDTDDFYKFPLEERDFLHVLVDVNGTTDGPLVAQMLAPDGTVLDTQPVTDLGALVSVVDAPEDGDYRLRVHAPAGEAVRYTMCFDPCFGFDEGIEPLELGDPLRNKDIQVLIVPPAHGDLGNPSGPTALDYVEQTIAAIETWEEAIHAFAEDHPEFGYLVELSVHVEVFDGVNTDRAGYDVVVAYVESGPYFRGIAQYGGCTGPQSTVEQLGLGEQVRTCAREMLISTFASSPLGGGQWVSDFPTGEDIYWVALHEFGGNLGLGHTLTLTEEHGPDAMWGAGYPYAYGDGQPIGEGNEETPTPCPSTLDLYGIAVLWDWIETGGEPFDNPDEVTLPEDMAYEVYC